MKYNREIKVAVLAIVCAALLYFGFHFLKGVNIFSPVKTYYGIYSELKGITEQTPVYIKGYKVGQVDRIEYDFSKPEPFTVTVSIDRQINLPEGSIMVLVQDGLIGGKAVDIELPDDFSVNTFLVSGDTLESKVEHSLMETVQTTLIAHIDSAVYTIDSLVAAITCIVEGDNIKRTLTNIDNISANLSVTSSDLKQFSHQRLPQIADSVQLAINNANDILTEVKSSGIKSSLARIDSTSYLLQNAVSQQAGTLGMLLHDKSLYEHIDSTVVAVDSLVSDIKANPKRYIHISVFGK